MAKETIDQKFRIEAGKLDVEYHNIMERIIATKGKDPLFIKKALDILVEMKGSKPALCYKAYFENYATIVVPLTKATEDWTKEEY